MHFFLRKHTYFHGIDILLDLKVMLCTRLFLIGSIFNVPLQTKTAFMGPLTGLGKQFRLCFKIVLGVHDQTCVSALIIGFSDNRRIVKAVAYIVYSLIKVYSTMMSASIVT